MTLSFRDAGLFLRSARTDARLRALGSGAAALEQLYAETPDPWASADWSHGYQGRKYDGILACLPAGRRFGHALDLGCGLGLMSERLLAHAGRVTGVDIAPSALARARQRTEGLPIEYLQADVASLPAALDGGFDLVVVADVLYYLPPPVDRPLLEGIAARIAKLLRPGGLVVIANHYVCALEPGSRLTRRIHAAFRGCPGLALTRSYRRIFYRVDVLARA